MLFFTFLEELRRIGIQSSLSACCNPIVMKWRETSGTSPKVKLTEPDSITIELQQALKEDWIPILLNSSKNVKNNIT